MEGKNMESNENKVKIKINDLESIISKGQTHYKEIEKKYIESTTKMIKRIQQLEQKYLGRLSTIEDILYSVSLENGLKDKLFDETVELDLKGSPSKTFEISKSMNSKEKICKRCKSEIKEILTSNFETQTHDEDIKNTLNKDKNEKIDNIKLTNKISKDKELNKQRTADSLNELSESESILIDILKNDNEEAIIQFFDEEEPDTKFNIQ